MDGLMSVCLSIRVGRLYNIRITSGVLFTHCCCLLHKDQVRPDIEIACTICTSRMGREEAIEYVTGGRRAYSYAFSY